MAQDMATLSGRLTSAFVQEFHHGFEIACQQKQSRLEAAVTSRGSITGESFTINDMGLVEMNDRTFADRFGDTVWNVPDAGTRIAMMQDADLYVPISPKDLPKLLAKPQGEYQSLMVAAAQRYKDRLIYAAMRGSITRKTVAADGTASTAQQALSASQSLFANGGAAATPKAISKADLTKVRSLFRKNEADDETIYGVYNSDMMQTILNDTTLTNADYMSVQMLQDGDVSKKWLGIQWIPYEALFTDATNGWQSAMFWTKSGVHFGTGMDLSLDIGPRRDKRNVIQLSAQTSYGAGRANEQKVVELKFKGV